METGIGTLAGSLVMGFLLYRYFQGMRVTSNGGLILVRELDERLGLEKLIEEYLSDSRQGMNQWFTLFELDI